MRMSNLDSIFKSRDITLPTKVFLVKAIVFPVVMYGCETQSMEFSRPEYWSGQPFPSPRDLPNPGIEPRSPALQADSLPAKPPGKPSMSASIDKLGDWD